MGGPFMGPGMRPMLDPPPGVIVNNHPPPAKAVAFPPRAQAQRRQTIPQVKVKAEEVEEVDSEDSVGSSERSNEVERRTREGNEEGPQANGLKKNTNEKVDSKATEDLAQDNVQLKTPRILPRKDVSYADL